VLTADVLRTQSTSVVSTSPAEADHTSVAEAANVNVLNGLVKATLVRAVAHTHADGSSASFSAAGSTITGLVVNGVAIANVTPNLTINLPALLFGANSYVAIFQQTGSTTTPPATQNSGGTYAADLTVNMIRVHVTGVLGVIPADVTVSNAVAHSDFPQTTVCTTSPRQAVSGHAFIASEQTNPSLLPIVLGFSSIPSTGGHGHQDLAAVNTAVLTTGLATSDSQGSLGTTSDTATSFANVANVCVLPGVGPGHCAVSATVVNPQSSTTGKSSGVSSTDKGTQLLGVNVLGLTIAANPAPNTVIELPGIGFIVLNEQFCDNGTAASHTCSGTNHSGLTVRSIDVVITQPILGLVPIGAEVIVGEAHSDATFGP
jgi:hypothetical protein